MQSFFGRVLPAVGPFTLLTGATGPDGKLSEQRHYNGLQTHVDVEREIQRLSATPVNVFYACGSYAGKNRSEPIAKRCLYLDLDGKDFGGVEDSLRQLALFVRTVGLPPPSLYVHSGRGVHVYWCLDRDVPVRDWLPVARALKAKCEELGFAADGSVTADAARILRAPGTLNRKGANPIPCRVMADNGTSHSLESISRQLSVERSAGVARLAELVSNDDLSTKRDFEKKTIEQLAEMLDHIHLSESGDRDKWITVLCGLQDATDKSEDGFALFHQWSSNEPGYDSEVDCLKIWESFSPGGGIGVGTLIRLAKEGGFVEQAPDPVPLLVGETPSLAQQIAAVPMSISAPTQPAAPAASASSLMLAANHAVTAAGRSRFEKNDAVQWLAHEFVLLTQQTGAYYSHTERTMFDPEAIDRLLNRYMPVANSRPTPASQLLKDYGTRQVVNSIGFHPGKGTVYTEQGKQYVNTYLPPDDPVMGTTQEIALIDMFFSYCFPNEEDKPFGDYLRQCYGHLVQHPETKIASALLIISAPGTGKTTLLYDIPKLLVGPHSARVVSNKTLRGAFSGYIVGAHLLYFDEVRIAGRWDSSDTANSLKNLVTGKDVEVRMMRTDAFNIPNRLFITASSNYNDAMSLEDDDERRWGVYELRPDGRWTAQQKEIFFSMLHAWLSLPRAAGVLRWYFSQVDISKFNPQGKPPITAAKLAMISQSKDIESRILVDAMSEEVGPFYKDIFTNQDVLSYLQIQTGKTLPAMVVRDLIRKACPSAIAIREIRTAAERVRVICWKRHAHWGSVSPEDLRKELQRSS